MCGAYLPFSVPNTSTSSCRGWYSNWRGRYFPAQITVVFHGCIVPRVHASMKQRAAHDSATVSSDLFLCPARPHHLLSCAGYSTPQESLPETVYGCVGGGGSDYTLRKSDVMVAISHTKAEIWGQNMVFRTGNFCVRDATWSGIGLSRSLDHDNRLQQIPRGEERGFDVYALIPVHVLPEPQVGLRRTGSN